MNIDELISKYQQKLLAYENYTDNNTGTTKYLCMVQRDLCKEILRDLKGETVIKVRKKRAVTKKKYRRARRIQS